VSGARDTRPSTKARFALTIAALALAPACAAVLGVDDIGYEGAGDGGLTDATLDGNTARDASDPRDSADAPLGTDAAADAPQGIPCDGSCVLLRVDGGNPRGLALDDAGTLYVAMYDRGAIYRVNEDGTGAGVAVSEAGAAIGVAVDGDLVYWGDTTASFVRYAKKADTTMRGAIPSVTPWDLKLGDGVLFWGEFVFNRLSNVRSYAPGSGVSGTLSQNEEPVAGLALDTAQVFLVTDPPDAAGGYVRRVPRSDAGATARSAAIPHGHHGVVSGGNLYFTAGAGVVEGAVYKLPVDFSDGNLPVALATGQGSPWGIAVRGNIVYFATFDDGQLHSTTTNGGPVFSLGVPCNGAFELLLTPAALYASCSQDGTVIKIPGPP
jgi:hypothetical protein